MTPALETIFPRQANNDYRGGAVPFYGFLLLIAQHAFSACVHLCIVIIRYERDFSDFFYAFELRLLFD